MQEVWTKMVGWNFVLPPNRPTDLHMALLVQTIQMLPSKSKACILGSTPEYRQVLRDAFESITIVDKSEEFHRVSSSIVGESPKETVIVSDWLSAFGSLEGRFDLIVSHYTHGNIPFSFRAQFFLLISSALKDSGLFFDCVFQPKADLFDYSAIEAHFNSALPNIRSANDMNCLGIFQGAHIRNHGIIDTTKAYEWLTAGHFSRRIQDIIGLTELVTPPGLSWDYSIGETPERLGYDEAFDVISSISEPPDSVFHGSVVHNTCRPKRRG